MSARRGPREGCLLHAVEQPHAFEQEERSEQFRDPFALFHVRQVVHFAYAEGLQLRDELVHVPEHSLAFEQVDERERRPGFRDADRFEHEVASIFDLTGGSMDHEAAHDGVERFVGEVEPGRASLLEAGAFGDALCEGVRLTALFAVLRFRFPKSYASDLRISENLCAADGKR